MRQILSEPFRVAHMEPLALVLVGALTGTLVGFTGVGGGALMTPVLMLGFSIAPLTAIATDLCFAALTKLAALRAFQPAGMVDGQVLRRLALGSLPTAALVVFFLEPEGGHDRPMPWLLPVVGGMVLLAALTLLLAPRWAAAGRSRRLADPARFKGRQGPLTVLAGVAMGAAVALTSVGAGALGSAVLLALYPLRMTPQRLVATDLAHALPLAALTGAAYALGGAVDWALLGWLLLGSLPAAYAASQLNLKTPERWLRPVLASVLVVLGLRLLLSAPSA
jgi:uncharacterized membrane protein YfcA